MIEVVDYDPAWPELFEQLRARAWAVLEGVALSIEHVGSTSVPGLAAKPIIDMSVVVASPVDVQKAIECLATIGYIHRGTLGVGAREAFFPPDGLPRHNLYVCPKGTLGVENHLAIRDYLRAHPDRARQYGELKKQLAVQFRNDIDGYVDGKTDLILGILRECGLPKDKLDAIENVNRKLEVREARSEEAERLTEIAHAAKRHWGYGEELIELWRSDLTVTPEFIDTHEVHCATRGSIVIGFYALLHDGDVFELEHMWVDPPWIRTGVGRALFTHASDVARSSGARVLRIGSDPNAVRFYEAMGAKIIGTLASTPEGRALPLLELSLTG